VKTGFFAQARIKAKTSAAPLPASNEVLVPTESLIGVTDGKASFYVLNGDQKTVRLVTVDFVRLEGNQALVRGIPAGVGIVTSGGAYVSDKAQVSVVEAKS
jgi:hypothetical protein